MTRRTFVATTAAVPFAAAAAEKLPIQKAVLWDMLPKSAPHRDRAKMALDCGFVAIECPQVDDPKEAEAIKAAADAEKLRIHSVMCQSHWKFPLSSADPQVVAQCIKGMETSLRNAHLWGADAVLLVPAVVDPKTSYHDAWTRSQAQIRKLIPLATELKVVIAVEEVWNKFLQSPLEFAKYVDEFKSPWVKAYFDVGNVVINGYPQDWIRTLNKRIVKLHLKDFKRPSNFTPLREGEIDWPEVHRALTEVGFRGFATVELRGGDAAYLKEVSHRVDLILSGA